MKRFTESNKWDDPWFSELTFEAKYVFGYLCDKCDACGVWEPNYRTANFNLRRDVDWDAVKSELGDRLRIIRGGKWWLTRFVIFQQGRLSENCYAHQNIIKLASYHGLFYKDGIVAVDEEHFNAISHAYPMPIPSITHANGLRYSRGRGNSIGKEEVQEKPSGKEAPKPRPRNLLMDALATESGIALNEIGAAVAKRLNACLTTIKQSTPELSPDEIHRRAANYRSLHPEWDFTPEALTKYWSSCGNGAQTVFRLPSNVREALAREQQPKQESSG